MSRKWDTTWDMLKRPVDDFNSLKSYKTDMVQNNKYMQPISLLPEDDDELEEARREELELYMEEVGSEFKRQTKKAAKKLAYEFKKEFFRW